MARVLRRLDQRVRGARGGRGRGEVRAVCRGQNGARRGAASGADSEGSAVGSSLTRNNPRFVLTNEDLSELEAIVYGGFDPMGWQYDLRYQLTPSSFGGKSWGLFVPQ